MAKHPGFLHTHFSPPKVFLREVSILGFLSLHNRFTHCWLQSQELQAWKGDFLHVLPPSRLIVFPPHSGSVDLLIWRHLPLLQQQAQGQTLSKHLLLLSPLLHGHVAYFAQIFHNGFDASLIKLL